MNGIIIKSLIEVIYFMDTWNELGDINGPGVKK